MKRQLPTVLATAAIIVTLLLCTRLIVHAIYANTAYILQELQNR